MCCLLNIRFDLRCSGNVPHGLRSWRRGLVFLEPGFELAIGCQGLLQSQRGQLHLLFSPLPVSQQSFPLGQQFQDTIQNRQIALHCLTPQAANQPLQSKELQA
jgi:hypothetical protein